MDNAIKNVRDEHTLNELLQCYKKHCKADYFIVGYVSQKVIYYNIVTDLQGAVLNVSSSDRGSKQCIKYRPTKEQRASLSKSGTALMTKKEYELLLSKINRERAAKNQKTINKGELLEKILTEKSGKKWYKDDTPFYMGSDLTIDNIGYQIKFYDATICTLEKLQELEQG